MRFIGLFGVLLLWEALAWLYGSPLLPSFRLVLREFMTTEFQQLAWQAAQTSLVEVMLGVGLAMLLGTGFGVAMAIWPTVRQVLLPVVDAARPVAALTLYPLIILVLGLGLESKVFIIFWTAWPAVLLNAMAGILAVETDYLEAAVLDGANEWRLLRGIQFPLSLPLVLTGYRIAVSGGWISLVSAEMLGGNNGLGYLVLRFAQTFQFTELYATIIVIALLGLLMTSGFNLTQALVERCLYDTVCPGSLRWRRIYVAPLERHP